jgi:hypothetical protein
MLKSLTRPALAVLLAGCATVASAADLSTLFGNGATWHLTLDDWDGDLVLSDAKINASDPNMTVLTARATWLHVGGTLEVREYTRDPRRAIHVSLATPDGHKFEAEGLVGRETDRFMAGVTRYASPNVTYFGAWYATNVGEGAAATREVTPNTAVRSDAPVQAVGECTIEGRIGGVLKLVGSITVTPAGTTKGTTVAVQMSSKGTYRATGLAPGTYRVTVHPAGKVGFRGTGIEQTAACRPGESVRLDTTIAGVGK